MGRKFKKRDHIPEETAIKIIACYKKTGTLRDTWIQFRYMEYSLDMIRDFLKEKNMLKEPYGKNREDSKPFIGYSQKPFTDETLDFEAEIKTAIFK